MNLTFLRIIANLNVPVNFDRLETAVSAIPDCPEGYLYASHAEDMLCGSGVSLDALVRCNHISGSIIDGHTFYRTDQITKVLDLLTVYPLNIKQTATRLNYSRQTIARYTRKGLIEHIVIGDQIRFSLATIAYLQRMREIYTLNSQDVLRRLRITGQTLRQLTREERLDCFKIDHTMYYRPDQVDRLKHRRDGYTTRELGELLGISKTPIERLCRLGYVKPTTGSDGVRRYSVSEVHRLRQMNIGYTTREVEVLLGIDNSTVTLITKRAGVRVTHDMFGYRRYHRGDVEQLRDNRLRMTAMKTTAEVAQILGVSVDTVTNLGNRQLLTYTKFGNGRRYTDAAIRSLLTKWTPTAKRPHP